MSPRPSKIVAVAKNYADHAAEMGSDAPTEPMIFLKPPSSIIRDGQQIVIPSISQRVDYEAELAIVIGEQCRNVPEHRVADVIAGFTVANDVTARDLQASDGQWARAKGFDTFCPVRDELTVDITLDDIANGLAVTCHVNGEERQSGTTADMIHSVPRLVSWIAAVMTLEVGDLVLTGTPAGVGQLFPADEVQVSVERVGTLTNPVVGSIEGSP